MDRDRVGDVPNSPTPVASTKCVLLLLAIEEETFIPRTACGNALGRQEQQRPRCPIDVVRMLVFGPVPDDLAERRVPSCARPSRERLSEGAQQCLLASQRKL